MDLYEMFDDITHSEDLLSCAKKICAFAEWALVQQNRKLLINRFVEYMNMRGLNSYLFNGITDNE